VVAFGGEQPPRDLVVRAGDQRLVAELADELASWFGLPRQVGAYGLVVERTGEHLVPERRLDQVDMREGDTLTLLRPGETAGSRSGRAPLRRLNAASVAGSGS
jgi:hypothetical protein